MIPVVKLNHVSEPDREGVRVMAYERDHDLHPHVVHFVRDSNADMRWGGSYLETAEEASAEFANLCKRYRVQKAFQSRGPDWFSEAGGTRA